MKLLEGLSNPVGAGDFYYDLFTGGYIRPKELVVPADAEKIAEAMKVIDDFEKLLEDNDLLEEM